MDKVLSLQDIKASELLREITAGKVFIYPTDTLYGLGCDATNPEAVMRIREIKQRATQPFSVIVPSTRWIYTHCHAKRQYVEKLPGPFTFIFRLKKLGILPSVVTPLDTIGVRIPDHPFTRHLQKARALFVTTSVNVSGTAPITDVRRIPRRISNAVDYIIDAGPLENQPSTIIDLTGEIARIVRP